MQIKFHIFSLFGVLALLISLGLSSCKSELLVTSDYDPNANFAAYMTYGVKMYEEDSERPVEINPAAQKRIASVIRQEMELHGYKEAVKPDLWISFYVKVTEAQDVASQKTSPAYRMGPYYYGPYWGYEPGWIKNQSIANFEEATLIIDIVDAEENQLVWFGSCTGPIDEYAPDADFRLRAAIIKIMSEYPFLAGSAKPILLEEN
jgi:hypothetical protein